MYTQKIIHRTIWKGRWVKNSYTFEQTLESNIQSTSESKKATDGIQIMNINNAKQFIQSQSRIIRLHNFIAMV